MIHPYAYRTGLIVSVIIVIWTIFSYLIGIEMFTNFWIPIVVMIAVVIYLIMALKKIRGFMGGFMTLVQGFINFLVMSAIFIFISSILNFLIVNVIDTEFGSEVNEVIIEKTIGMMEKFGAPEAEIEKQVIELETKLESQRGFGGMLLNMLQSLAFFAVIGLIAAAVLKKNPDQSAETLETLD